MPDPIPTAFLAPAELADLIFTERADRSTYRGEWGSDPFAWLLAFVDRHPGVELSQACGAYLRTVQPQEQQEIDGRVRDWVAAAVTLIVEHRDPPSAHTLAILEALTEKLGAPSAIETFRAAHNVRL